MLVSGIVSTTFIFNVDDSLVASLAYAGKTLALKQGKNEAIRETLVLVRTH